MPGYCSRWRSSSWHQLPFEYLVLYVQGCDENSEQVVQNVQGPLRLSAVSDVPLIFPEAPLMHFLDPEALKYPT